MKRFLCLLLAVLLCMSLFAACGKQDTAQTPPPEPTPEAEPETPAEPEPEPEEEPEPEPEEAPAPADPEPPAPESKPETVPPVDDGSYTMRLDAFVRIFDGPSYDHDYVGIVGENGTYTIVYEVEDAEGNQWGELKSGIGWVDLTAAANAEPQPVSGALAPDANAKTDYAIYLTEDPQFCTTMLFRANEQITNVEILSVMLDGDTLAEITPLDALETVKAGQTIMIDALFPGDMTTYALRFHDGSGELRYFLFTLSGRNGDLILWEHILE